MKKLVCLFMMLFLTIAMADLDVVVKGAEPGAWTMDMEAALSQAKLKKMPVLLFFTGSDWCGWCGKLEKNVLVKEAWNAFARENLMLVYLDFPQDKTKVPEQFRARNEKLRDKYEIEGYPTLVLIDENEKKLGDIHYEDTVEKFIFKVMQPLRFHGRFFGKFTAGMPEEELRELQKERQAMEENSRRVGELLEQISTLSQETERLAAKTDRDMDGWIVRSRLPGKLDEFRKTTEKYSAALDEFNDWLKSAPEKNEENQRKFRQLRDEVQKLEEEKARLLSEAMNSLERK